MARYVLCAVLAAVCLVSLATAQSCNPAVVPSGCAAGAYCDSDRVCRAQKVPGSFCASGVECISGICTNGVCVGGCLTTANCAAGQICSNGACITPQCNPAIVPSGCAAGSWCTSSRVCVPQKASGSSCALGVECISGVCTNGFCIGGCLSSTNCPSGQSCINGVCTITATKVDGSLCAINAECNSGLCFQSYCRAPCVPGLPSSVCATGFTCQNTGLIGGGACIPTAIYRPGLDDGCSCLFNSQCSSGICNCGICGYQCSNNWQCPPGLFCAGGFCKASSILPAGAPCCVSAQCASGNCFCGYCCAQCFTSAQCPLGFFCNTITGSCSIALKGNGVPCVAESECQSGYCWNGVCSSRCFSSFDCPSGYICSSGSCIQGGCSSSSECASGYVCINRQCVITLKPIGATCTADSQCESNICASGTCSTRCVVATDCPLGYTCNFNTGRCEWNEKPNGAICTQDYECISRVCDEVLNVCTQFCTPVEGAGKIDCPVGFQCDATRAICVSTKTADYGSCTFDSDCLSGICNVGYCGNCKTVGCQVSGYTCDAASGRCTLALLPIGSSCVFNSQCQSGFCTSGRCSVACTATSCGAGFYCLNGVCYPGCSTDRDCGVNSFCQNNRCFASIALPNGALCAFDSNCQSGWCCGGQCRSRIPVGGRCQTNDECISGVCDNSYSWCAWGVCAVACTPFNSLGCPANWYCASSPSRWSQPCCVPNNCQVYGPYCLSDKDEPDNITVALLPNKPLGVDEVVDSQVAVATLGSTIAEWNI